MDETETINHQETPYARGILAGLQNRVRFPHVFDSVATREYRAERRRKNRQARHSRAINRRR